MVEVVKIPRNPLDEAPYIWKLIVQEDSAGTLKEKQLHTAVGPKYGKAMKIYGFYVDLSVPDPSNTANETADRFAALSTRQGLSAVPGAHEAHCIREWHNFRRNADAGTTVAQVYQMDIKWHSHGADIPPAPIFVADDILSVYLQSVNCTSAATLKLQIFYDLVDLPYDTLVKILEQYR